MCRLRNIAMRDYQESVTSGLNGQTDAGLSNLYVPLCFEGDTKMLNYFHGAFATSVACQQGTLTLPDTRFRPPLWDLLKLQLLRPDSSNLPCLYSTFHLEYPLVLSRFCLSFK